MIRVTNYVINWGCIAPHKGVRIEPHYLNFKIIKILIFVEGYIQAHSDTQAWKELVRKVGKEEALQALRHSFKSADTRKKRNKILVH
jgi:hypothetical protein